MTYKLRIGIILDSMVVPKWIEKIITEIRNTNFLDLKIVINKNYFPNRDGRRKYKHFLYNQYCKLDYKYYSSKIKENAFERVDIESALTKSQTIILHKSKLAQDDIENLKKENLDIIIQFGMCDITKQIKDLVKYGVWYYPHDHFGEGYSSEPKFIRAMFNSNVPLEISLNSYSEDCDRCAVLYKTKSPVTRDSLFFNGNAVYWKATEFILRKLRNLNERNLNREINLSEITENENEVNLPENLETIKLLFNLGMEKIKSRIYYEQWFLAFKKVNDGKNNYTIIRPPHDRFYADPFIIKRDNRTYIFFEEFIYNKGKGDISVLEIDPETNKCSTPIKVLEKPYHLSYPFLFEWDNEIYMIPETSGNKTVELYKATNFPYEWELEKVLIKGINAVDATVIHNNNKFWMFANVFVDGSSSLDELHIFYSDSLLGEWVPHRMNPVISDASSARPAGNIFLKDGKLIRPSQDCSYSYGYSVKYNHIVELTEEEYSEVFFDEMKPDWFKNNKGTHTYNFNEDYEVIDGRISKNRLIK